LSLCFLLFFTFWVTSWKSAREALTSRLLCFTTRFPGSPKGLPPQHFSISSNAVHMSGYKVTLKKGWAFEAILPAPKKPQKLPIVLSPEEVIHFSTVSPLPSIASFWPPAMQQACVSQRRFVSNLPLLTASGWCCVSSRERDRKTAT
jgi:hypothetical protein